MNLVSTYVRALRRICIGLAALIVGYFVVASVGFFRPHVRDFSGSTYDKFVTKAKSDFSLPRSAKDIRVVYSSVGIAGRAHVVKFTAPIEDCRQYALADFRHYDEQRDNTSPHEFVPIAGRPSVPASLDAYGVRDLSWFDVQNIEEGITLERDHDHRPWTWIDTQRGILYSYWTD